MIHDTLEELTKFKVYREDIHGLSKLRWSNMVSTSSFLTHYRPRFIHPGDVVRIAPNELVFVTPQAAKGDFTPSITLSRLR